MAHEVVIELMCTVLYSPQGPLKPATTVLLIFEEGGMAHEVVIELMCPVLYPP